MAHYNAPATLTTPGGTIHFNALTGDTYMHDPTQCAGLDMVPTRVTVDDRPVTDGGIVFPAFKTARHPTFGGQLLIRGNGDYATARNALENALNAALESIQPREGGPTGTYVWTPAGSGAKTITVYCEIPATYTGANQKNYLFGLVAANPAIT